MNNDQNLDIVSEILQGVSIVDSSFGILYFKHLSQQEQREIISKSKVFKTEAKSKGLMTEKEALSELFSQEMWTQEEESLIAEYKKEIENSKESMVLQVLPSKVKLLQKSIDSIDKKLSEIQSSRSSLLGLTCEKYVHNKTQKSVIQNILYYDSDFKKPVFDELYINESSREIEIYKLQQGFFEKFQDDNISKAVLSDYFSMYLPFCEDVLGVFGKPLKDLTNYQLKLISYGRYFLNIFKNTAKSIPENVAKDPELLMNFYQSQRSDSKTTKSREGQGASTYFGASREDIEALKSDNEKSIDLSEEVKKRGGSLNMQQMMELHGV